MKKMIDHITGIILSGGNSRRMGQNKALLPLGEITIIEHVANLMNSIFTNVILITNTPDEYKFLDLPMFEDIFKVGGPLAGIHSGLVNSKTDENFILSCDMPLMKSEIIKSIIEFGTDKPITVCSSEGMLQHLAGRYSKSVLQNAEGLLKREAENNDPKTRKHCAKVYSLLTNVGFEEIKAEDLPGHNSTVFFNMNNKEDYEKILSMF
ncbi:MAG: molybdenum cofactor guanylyltransferase [Bacteroidota bacterium]